MKPRTELSYADSTAIHLAIAEHRYADLQKLFESGRADPFVDLGIQRTILLVDLLIAQSTGDVFHGGSIQSFDSCLRYVLTTWEEELRAYRPEVQEGGTVFTPAWPDLAICRAARKANFTTLRALLDWGCDPNAYIPSIQWAPLSVLMQANEDWDHIKKGLNLLLSAGAHWNIDGTNILFFNLGYFHPLSFNWAVMHGALDGVSDELRSELKRKLMLNYPSKKAYKMVDDVRFYVDRVEMPMPGALHTQMIGWAMVYRPS